MSLVLTDLLGIKLSLSVGGGLKNIFCPRYKFNYFKLLEKWTEEHKVGRRSVFTSMHCLLRGSGKIFIMASRIFFLLCHQFIYHKIIF